MGEATLKFRTEGGREAVAVIQELERALAASQQRIDGINAAGRQRRARGAREERRVVVEEAQQTAQGVGGAYRQGRVVVEREEKLVTRAKLRELALQGEAQKKFIERYTEAHKRATALLEAEVGKRGQLSDREKRQAEDLALAMVSEHEQAERRKTAATQREARKRETQTAQTQREVGGRFQRGAEAVAGAAAGVARDAHGQIQDARERRAAVDHSLNAALFQAGVFGAEAQGARDTVRARAQALGMDPTVLAEALGQAQTQFSVLSGDSPAARQRALQQQLDLAEFAQSTYQDPAEVMRVAGMLQAQGVRGNDQRATLLAMTGIAQAGSVELRDIVSQGLGPLMQNVAIATGRLGPGATEEQRSAAVREATLRTMAMQEVASRGGGNVRASMNAFAAFERAMTNDRTATNMRSSLERRGFTEAQIGEVLMRERDARSGRTVDRFRSNDALVTLSRMNSLFRGNTTELMNALSSGGPGLPTVLLSNIRTLASTLNSQTEGGETVQQRVERMRREGSAFTERSVAAGRDLVQSEDATRLAREAQQRDSALLDNTGAIRDLSTAIRSFQAQNPILSNALGTAGGAVLGAGGSALAGFVGQRGVGGAATAVTARLAGMSGAAALGTKAAAVVASLGAGLGIGSLANQVIYSDRDRANGLQTNAFSRAYWSDFTTAVRQAITDGFSDAPSSNAAVHAQTVRTTPTASP
jgi:hypothetical protein